MKEWKPSISVIGAGLSGLVAAWELARNGYVVQLMEQHSTAGGMLSSMRLGHEYIELLPHHIAKSDRAVLGLFRELGLLDEIEWFDSLWYGRAGRKKLGYPSKGFHSLISALIQEITDRGGFIHYGYTVMDIAHRPAKAGDEGVSQSGFLISCVLSDCTTITIESDYVLYTASCRNFAHITHDLDLPTEYRDALMDVTYRADISLLLLTKIQLNGCFSRPVAINAPFQRMIEHTNLVGEKKYGGHVIYLSGAFSTTNPLWTQSDAEVFSEFFKHLQLQNPSVRRSDILTWRLTRTRYATPTYRFGDTMVSPIPGLLVTGLGLPEGNAENRFRMDSCISAARSAARSIVAAEAIDLNAVSESAGGAVIDRIY